MGAILVRVWNASRRPLDDRMDIEVVSTDSNTTAAKVRDVSGSAAITINGLLETRPYIVRVFPSRHRPVAKVTFAGSDARPNQVDLHSPLYPDRVRAVTFPAYPDLPADLKRVLAQSTVEGTQGSGAALYAALSDTQKAGLLNLFVKMSGRTLADGRSVWSFVERIYGVRPDRIFVDVQPGLRELVGSAVTPDIFREVPGSLHTPPLGFGHAGSFKTAEPYGNLQLTFFSANDPPLSYKVDCDIDDAAGLGHAFQVIRNWVTDGTTHPYDIHQILLYRQDATLPYELA